MRISNRERILLIALIIVVVIWASFTYIIEDQWKELDRNETEIDLNEKELVSLKGLIEQEPAIDAAIESNYLTIQEVAETFFNTTTQEERILLLSDFLLMPFIDDTAIRFNEPETIDINGLLFQKDTVTLEFVGQYESLFNMMKTMWAFPKAIDISFLEIEEVKVSADKESIVEGDLVGKVNLDFYTFSAESGVVDNLYKWYVDELFFKENPFEPITENNIVVRYLYLPDDDLFNYSKYFEFTDIDGHWLEDEINEFLDYGYLYLNPYLEFGPDEPITRGEFIVMLDSVYGWPINNEDIDLTEFRDYGELGSLESAFAKAIHRGYLSGFVEGYEDNTLRARDPITYSEAELIMQRVKESEAFTWTEIADSFEWRKDIVNPKWYNMDSTLSKAEAVYMLYYYK